MPDRFDEMGLEELQEEARELGVPIRARNEAQLRYDVRERWLGIEDSVRMEPEPQEAPEPDEVEAEPEPEQVPPQRRRQTAPAPESQRSDHEPERRGMPNWFWTTIGIIAALAAMLVLGTGAIWVMSSLSAEEVVEVTRVVETEVEVTKEVEVEVEKEVVVQVTATPEPTDDTGGSSAPAPIGAVSCMTDSDVLALFGLNAGEIVRTDAPWDSCKWNRQNVPSTMSITLPQGWGLTYTDPDGNVWVTVGRGQSVMVRGFTLRQPGNQFLELGPDGYFQEEWEFGYAPERGTSTYPHCPDEVMADLVTLTTEQQRICAAQGTTPASAQSGPVEQTETDTSGERKFPDCPSDDASWYAENIGGNVAYWTFPDWEGGAWVFRHKENWYELCWPGSGRLDYWDGNIGDAASLISESCVTVDEASFHCKQ